MGEDVGQGLEWVNAGPWIGAGSAVSKINPQLQHGTSYSRFNQE